jgi:hypothetical protein
MPDYNFEIYVAIEGYFVPMSGTLICDEGDNYCIRWDVQSLSKDKALCTLLGAEKYLDYMKVLVIELNQERKEYYKQMKAGV